MEIRCRFFWIIILGVMVSVPYYARAVDASSEQASYFVQQLSNQILSVVNEEQFDDGAKEECLKAMFDQTVDIKWIGRFVLGRYWRRASEEQRIEYQQLYKQFLLQTYVPQFREYNQERLELLKTVADEGGDVEEYVVHTHVVAENMPDTRIDYHVRKVATSYQVPAKDQCGMGVLPYRGYDYRVIDVVAEGISMIAAQRSEFNAVLSRRGLDYLLTKLRDRAEAYE